MKRHDSEQSTVLVALTATIEFPSLGQSWARRAVHALLGKLERGHLRLEEEGGQVCEFGEPRATATIKATIRVRDSQLYHQVVRNGSIGAGEAFMQGWWDSPDLVEVTRLFSANLTVNDSLQASPWRHLALRVQHWLHRNHKDGSRSNIAAHYDLGNDFFRLFLDDTLAYSAGIFLHETATLEQASLAKFRRLCDMLELKPDDHLLEIGTGWGGLAIFAARNYGCRVTTTTISRQQALHAREWVQREGLQDRITVLEQDYRDLQGSYDKLVSVEMIEAVGPEYYAGYFRQCSALLKPDGLMMLQAITIPGQRYEESLNSSDFIKRYIFPGGQLPSISTITSHIDRCTDLQLLDLIDITLDYARTLHEWRERFNRNLAEVRRLGFDDVFIRMWQYYLCFCEGGFRERAINTNQLLFAKPGYRKAVG